MWRVKRSEHGKQEFGTLCLIAAFRILASAMNPLLNPWPPCLGSYKDFCWDWGLYHRVERWAWWEMDIILLFGSQIRVLGKNYWWTTLSSLRVLLTRSQQAHCEADSTSLPNAFCSWDMCCALGKVCKLWQPSSVAKARSEHSSASISLCVLLPHGTGLKASGTPQREH